MILEFTDILHIFSAQYSACVWKCVQGVEWGEDIFCSHIQVLLQLRFLCWRDCHIKEKEENPSLVCSTMFEIVSESSDLIFLHLSVAMKYPRVHKPLCNPKTLHFPFLYHKNHLSRWVKSDLDSNLVVSVDNIKEESFSCAVNKKKSSWFTYSVFMNYTSQKLSTQLAACVTTAFFMPTMGIMWYLFNQLFHEYIILVNDRFVANIQVW